MKILKMGKSSIDWVGKCTVCGAIMEGKKSELNVSGNTTYFSWCRYCNAQIVHFYLLNTSMGKSIMKEIK